MTHTIFGHSMLYTAKTLPCPIHFTPLHSQHANMHGRPCFLQVYFRLLQLSLRQHLTTTNKFSVADVKSVIRTSRWSSTLRRLTSQFSGFSWSPFPTHCYTNSSTRCGSAQLQPSDRGRICTCTFVKFVATFSQKLLHRSAFKLVSLEN